MYIDKASRKGIEESAFAVSSVSDLAYELTVFVLSMWNQSPTDRTAEQITQELVVEPKNSKLVQNLRSTFADRFTVAQIHTACRIAYDEFYQRILRLHRAVQCRENGDIAGYAEAMKPLLDKLGQEIKKESVGGIIVPEGVKV